MPRHLSTLALALALLALPAPSLPAADTGEEWQDPLVIGRNEQPTHATLLSYATVEQALQGTREASPFVRPRLRSFDEATADGWTVEAQLFDPEQRPVLTTPLHKDARAILNPGPGGP